MSIAPISTTGPDATSAVSGHHGHHGERKVAFDAAAKALGMSTDDLKAALRSGSTIGSLATDRGVSVDDVKKAMSDAISAANPNMNPDRVALLVQRFVDGPSAGSPGTNSGASMQANGRDRDGDGDGH
jgi:hypothetical protein